MIEVTHLWLFVVSGLVVNILPGPDSLYIVGRGAGQGFKAGVIATLGVGTGSAIHALAAAFGLSALLASSAIAFSAIKYLGAIYLLYLAITMLLSQRDNKSEPTVNAIQLNALPYKKIYYQGLLTALLNPKQAVFFLSFVPQFISPDAADKTLSFIFLGAVFIFNGMSWCFFLAWSSAASGALFRQNKVLTKWLTRMAAGLFGYFGLRLGFGES